MRGPPGEKSGLGTAGGAAIGGLSGKPLTGAAMGAAAGTASGFLYDRHKKSKGE
ncbi:MAG: glycine zipper domain-containing protein [Gammaproteobacteria bacterium]|nr:glycine zipper domain-containing protein [Gammaproteobacteria bacterium]MDJ0872032.1 glycine zipper domain-containing protein [Gammaproteobacteria bacterium]